VVFVELSKKIVSLTEKIELLISDKNEETCALLLTQRQQLLVELSEWVSSHVEGAANKQEMMEQYHQFLRNIQRRDNVHIEKINKSKQEVLGSLQRQLKGSKAVSAYKNVVLD